MDHVVALRDALQLLSSAADLDDRLTGLLADLRRASPSSLGLEVLTTVAGQHVRVARFLPGVRPHDVTTSLEIPFVDGATEQLQGSGPVRIIFYGGRPGAFVDLAADLAYAEGVPLDSLVLDGDQPASTASGVRGLERVSLVQRAVGVLIAQGVAPDEAYDRLVSEALARSTQLADHARAVVDQAVQAARRRGHRDAPDGTGT